MKGGREGDGRWTRRFFRCLTNLEKQGALEEGGGGDGGHHRILGSRRTCGQKAVCLGESGTVCPTLSDTS